VKVLRLGIDLGSRQVKIVIVENGQISSFKSYETIKFYKEYIRQENECLVVNFPRLGFDNIESLVSTGYGRNAVKLVGGEDMPEIKAHALGAVWQTGCQDFTLLDLGGQDSKVILVRAGRLVDFQTNDRCAASSGRYLENMAAVLGITIDEMGNYDHDPVELSSTCAIFGESELIGMIIEGMPVHRLAAGVNYTIFKRVQPMLRQLTSKTIVFTGGVAHNLALRRIITRETGIEVLVPDHPQYNGAIGCCVYGGYLNEGSKRRK
jgi:predicted CoA-substrate-specific enzyme activase